MKNKSILNEGYTTNNIFDAGKKQFIFKNKKKFLDLSFGAGTLILGHQSKIFQQTLKEIYKKNLSLIATPNTEALKYSNLLKKIFPKYSKFVFCNTGSEAILKSIRIANAISKKEMIINVTGSWHGSVDRTLFTSSRSLASIPISSGLTNFNKKNIKFIPYNNIIKSKKILNKYKNKISCILIEPIQASLPQTQVKKFLKFLDSYSKKNNIILIFDETISGIRFNGQSVQQIFKLNPDISTFGKCLGGGLPIGIIALRKSILIKLNNLNQKVFFGGTFSANQISSYLGRKTIEFILKNKKKIFLDLEKKSFYFEKEVKNFILQNKINANIFRYFSMLRIVFSKKIPIDRVERDFLEKNKNKKIEKFRNFLTLRGINYPSNGILFLSTETNFSDLKKIIKNINVGLLKYFK
jgi:glutamate-1-semialdehyde 2,1-aminomutase